MKYFKLKFLLIFAALAMALPPAWAETTVEFDFTSNNWNIPTGSTNSPTQGENQYTYNGYTITLYSLSGQGYSNHGYYYNSTSNYLMMMRNSARLILPAFDRVVSKIEVICTSGTSSSATQNIFLSNTNTAVSTETKSAGTHDYVINESYQDIGTVYSLKQTANYNAQVQKVIVYLKEDANAPYIEVDPEDGLTINDVTGDNVAKTGTLTATLYNGQGELTATSSSSVWSWNNNTATFAGYSYDNGNKIYLPLHDEATVTFSSTNVTDVTADLEYNYTGPLYIIGTVNGGSWSANNMVDLEGPDADGIYTATFTSAAGDEGKSWISFSKRKGDNWDSWSQIENYRFTPLGETAYTAYWLTEEKIGKWIDFDFDPSHVDSQPLRMDPGTYTITIDAKNNRFKIEVYEAPVSKVYNKVVHSSQLIAGKKYILVYEDTPAFLGGISTTSTKYGLSITGPALDDNSVNIGQYSDIRELTLSGDASGWSFHNGDGYLTWTSGNSLNVADEISDYAKWTVTSDFALLNVSDSNRKLLYNTNPVRFACYDLTNTNITTYGVLYVEDGVEPVYPSVENPTFSPAERNFAASVDVTIECETDGATIYYTLDGTEPSATSTAYTEPIHLTATTTIKAIAVLDEDASSVVEATYTKTGIETIAEVKALADKTNLTYIGNAVVTFQRGNNLFVRDETGSLMLYYGSGFAQDFNNGDILTPEWSGKYQLYNSIPEVNLSADVTSTVNNGPADPEVLTVLNIADVNKYAKIDNVTITRSDTDHNNYYFTVDENEYCLHCAYTDLVSGLTVGKRYNVTGIASIYNNEPQLNLITADLIKEDLTLEFEPASVEIYVGDTFTAPTLTGVPEGETINVAYSSSNTDVAIVTDNVVSLVEGATGTATITATFAGNEYYNPTTATYTITVKAKEDVTLSFGENPDVELTIGDDFTAPKLTGAPEGATVTYESSNTAVATVDENGNVTIVGVGTAKITASYAGNSQYNPATASYTIKVNDVVVGLAAPTFSPKAGTYTEPKEVAIACATPGVTIEYTIDGVTKTYDGPFTVDHSCTVTATAKMGTRTVYTPAANSAQYTINAVPAANVADDYYYLQSKAAEVSGKYANVAGRRTLNFVADADKQAGTVFRIKTDPDTVGQVETLRSQAVDLQGYANRAMAYVPKAIDLVLSTLANSSLGDPETPGTGILGENGVDLILKKFYEKFDYNLYIEQAEGGYRIYGKTPSMQHVVDFYHENTAQVEEKLPMLEDYINQVLDKIRSKIPAPYDANVVVPFSLKTVRDRIADKYGISLIDPTVDEMGFYRQVLNNKEYVWDFAYQTAMMYVDVIKQTGTYQSLPAEYKLYVEKMEKVRPDTKYYIIERGNELDYISENNTEIINNDPRTLWSLTKREKFTVNVPEANKLNDSYYTTLYTDFAYSLPEDVKAYAVTGIDANDVAELAEITGTIPAQTPVLLKATAVGDKELTLKMDSRDGAVEGNLLEGPDYLVKTYGITSPTVVGLFNMAAGFVPAETLAEYEYLKLRTSGTVNNKYFWSVNDALDSCTYKNANNENDCVVRSLAVKNGTLAFSEHWTTETNKAFLVGDVNKPVIYLEKETLAAPTFSPVPGSYTVNNGESVTITITAEDDATIYYKIGDGEYQPYNGPITASDDMTIVAKAEKDGMIASDEVTAVYVIDNPTVLPDVDIEPGYYQIKNLGNNKYANVAGRKTLNFKSEDEAKTEAGTVIWLETNGKGQVQSIRSQAADLQRYADRVVEYYVPKAVELVVEKLHADGAGNILGENGLDAIMDKFNESFDHHLYVEPAEGGYRIYGKTPSMQPVVDFYREHTAQVEAKLPMLESFINSALDKLKEKLGGQSVFTPFSLHQIWENMGGTLTKPEDEASTMAFYREVLNNKNYVWDFAYQTAMIYVNNLKNHPRWAEVEENLGEYAQYIDMIEQVRPDFKYYIVQKDDKPDFISEGNVDIINNEGRTIWTLVPCSTFDVKIDNNQFGCPNVGGVGGYATTLYTDFAYTVPDGVTAYKVTSIEGGQATIEALSGIIPAQTPVLLTAKVDKAYTLTLTTDAGTADMDGNLLYGPDYLIDKYDLKTAQVQSLFEQIKAKLGQDFYNNYVAQYEYLADLNSGTVNNKYFWGLKQSDVEKCSNDGGEDCVVRNLSGDKFIDNWKVETNKAFLVTEEYAEITLSNLHGDVNHDGLVNIKDVTDLIDRLLGMPDSNTGELVACPICSDVNQDGVINIGDVTALIDILLWRDISTETGD